MLDYIEIYNRLTKEFFKRFLNKYDFDNIVFSPFSILALLALGANSTSGNTRDEILNVISDKFGIDDLNVLLAEIQTTLSQGASFNSASAAIVKEDIKNSIKPGYKEKINLILGADLILSENIEGDVNVWIREKTGGLIKDISDESMANMLVSFINAVVYDAPWLVPYDEDDIGSGYFTNADETISEITTLSSREHVYIENEFFTGFEKPYKNGYSFVGLLPKKKHSSSFINLAVDELNFNELLTSAKAEEVFVKMPEFNFEFQKNLNEICKNFGMIEIFENGADFSEMSKENLKLDLIIHKARLELNHKGTKATAVSMMSCAAGCVSMEFKRVILDRPFVYGIVNDKTGLPVFVGMVNNL